MAYTQVNSDFYKAFSTKNISLMGTVWHNSPHVQCIHPGAKPLVGYDNIISMWSNMFQVLKSTPSCASPCIALICTTRGVCPVYESEGARVH